MKINLRQVIEALNPVKPPEIMFAAIVLYAIGLLVLIALFIAAPFAWYFMNKWLQDFAYRISVSGWIFLVTGIVAVVIALFTVGFHAVRAAMANPVKSLRTE